MSTSALAIPRWRTQVLTRVADYFELTKPRIASLVLVTVAVAGYVARWGQPDPLLLLHTLIGTFLVAASASALNQWLEARRDALMQRTADRPLPAGRLSSKEVVGFAALTIPAGVLYLGLLVNWLTALIGLMTWVLYVWVYTPLKSRTSLNTAVGAIAGALPVLMGWTAMGQTINPSVDPSAAGMFMIVFLWQFPHFMAIAWIYRKQYARAKLKMLPVVDPTGRKAGIHAVVAALALLPISFVPCLMSPSLVIYAACAMALGVGQLCCAVMFCTRMSDVSARRLLRASLIYLPALLGLLIIVPLL